MTIANLGPEDAAEIRADLIEADRLRRIGADPGNAFLMGRQLGRVATQIAAESFTHELAEVVSLSDFFDNTEDNELPPTA